MFVSDYDEMDSWTVALVFDANRYGIIICMSTVYISVSIVRFKV